MLGSLDLILPAVAAGGSAAAAWALLERLYVPIPPNRALVLFGRRARSPAPTAGSDGNAVAREPRILIGGGAFLAPWNRAHATLSLAPLDVEATVRALHAMDAGAADGWEVVLQVQVKVPAEARALRAAAENLLGLGDDELRAYVRRSVEGVVPSVLARIPRDGAEPDWDRLGAELQAAIAPDLVTAGLIVRTVAVRELRRIGAAPRPERPGESRRRPGWSPPLAGAAGRRDEADLRLARVERGLRVLAADLARLLRDEPVRPLEDVRWLEAPTAEPPAPSPHESIAPGRPPAPTRPDWTASTDAEASP
ncbi:MAG TPA: hypothetical protein VML53_01840 [Thermoplasmata archaeon]|nr:hypothetical protein [Thermoplasmata archaeon]